MRGGAGALTAALANYFVSLGGEIQTGNEVRSLEHLPDAAAVLFDTSAESMARIAGDQLPASYHRKLAQLRHGPGICKVDWTLHGPIPWNSEFCHQAGTVHLAGGFDEVATHEKAACNGMMTETPFVLVTQPSVFDPSRAPNGKHIGWAYCHVPHACDEDYSKLIEDRIEKYAPGFKDQIIDRHVLTTGQLEQYNANYIGGDISCGAMDRKTGAFPSNLQNRSLFDSQSKDLSLFSCDTTWTWCSRHVWLLRGSFSIAKTATLIVVKCANGQSTNKPF